VALRRLSKQLLTQRGHCNGWEAGNWLALFAENFMHEISDVPGTELFQEIGAMEIDGTRADAECPSGLLAGGTPNDLSQRNTFFGSQNLMSGERFRQDIQRAI
jgi:hypothetical protein